MALAPREQQLAFINDIVTPLVEFDADDSQELIDFKPQCPYVILLKVLLNCRINSYFLLTYHRRFSLYGAAQLLLVFFL